MTYLNRFKNSIEKIQTLELKTLEGIKYFLFGVIVVDLFGIYWYFELKKLGIALLMVTIVCLSLILILEKRRYTLKMDSKQEKIKQLKEELKELEQEEEPEENKEQKNGFDMGLPDSDEYNKRLKNAFGSF